MRARFVGMLLVLGLATPCDGASGTAWKDNVGVAGAYGGSKWGGGGDGAWAMGVNKRVALSRRLWIDAGLRYASMTGRNEGSVVRGTTGDVVYEGEGRVRMGVIEVPAVVSAGTAVGRGCRGRVGLGVIASLVSSAHFVAGQTGDNVEYDMPGVADTGLGSVACAGISRGHVEVFVEWYRMLTSPRGGARPDGSALLVSVDYDSVERSLVGVSYRF